MEEEQDDILSPDQQITLMKIDLEIEEVIRALDEGMGDTWEDPADRGLVINHLRWAWIEGYIARQDDEINGRELRAALRSLAENSP